MSSEEFQKKMDRIKARYAGDASLPPDTACELVQDLFDLVSQLTGRVAQLERHPSDDV